MKVVIWGAGRFGIRLLRRLGAERAAAFIDNNPAKQGTVLEGIPVISYEQYKESYREYLIVIALMWTKELVAWLEQNGEYAYLVATDGPQEIVWGCEGENLLDVLPFEYNVKLPNVIVGINLFALLLMEKLSIQGAEEIYLFPESGLSEERRRVLRKYLADYYQENEDIFRHECNVFQGKRTEYLFCNEKSHYYNCMDFSHQIAGYFCEKMLKYKGRYSGERCFIIATGPSLRYPDLDLLYEKHEHSISMNKIFYAFSNTSWRPDFYFVNDPQLIEQNLEAINGLQLENMFAGDLASVRLTDDFIRFHSIYRPYEDKEMHFSEDLEWGSYLGGTITYDCIQFAVYAGFREIYLYGVDFNVEKINQVGNHFYEKEDKIEGVGRFNQSINDYSLLAFQTARKYADDHGIKIYNATRGGKLEVFERVDFDSLFG